MNTNPLNMSNIKIITHPGRAHRDEFVACALLMASLKEHNISLLRRDPTDVELADPDVYVVDIGQQFDPKLKNFDHHQFPRTEAPQCAITLVMKYLGIYEIAQEYFDWVEVSEVFDCTGPKATAKFLEIGFRPFMKTLSPVEEFALKAFSEHTHITYAGDTRWNDWVGDMMVEIGTSMLETLELNVEREAWLKKNHALVRLEDDYWAIYVRRPDEGLAEPGLGMSRLKHRLQEEYPDREIILSITPDDRGPGYALYRYEDHPAVDFNMITENKPGLDSLLEFVASTGFIAKTRENLPMDTLLELATASLLPKVELAEA